jgi:RNA polymerase sigma-70 factor (ECF subfamily)
VSNSDEQGLIGLLAADVIAYGDGGGKALAFPRPVHGRERMARLLRGATAGRERLLITEMRLAEINGQPWAILVNRDGRVGLIVSLDIADDLVQTVRAVTNPDKLKHLRPRTSA